MSCERLIATFLPGLEPGAYEITSPTTDDYNCISWALGETHRRWDPLGILPDHWPVGLARNDRVETIEAALRLEGFESCDADALEDGMEKVALFADGAHFTSRRPAAAIRPLDQQARRLLRHRARARRPSQNSERQCRVPLRGSRRLHAPSPPHRLATHLIYRRAARPRGATGDAAEARGCPFSRSSVAGLRESSTYTTGAGSS